jgi:hypothetical protein
MTAIHIKEFKTSMREQLRHKPIAWAYVFSSTLILLFVFLMYLTFRGGNPFHNNGTPAIFDKYGVEVKELHRGQWFYVRRDVCVDEDIYAEQNPSLYDLSRKSYIALLGAASTVKKGCSVRSSGFEIPSTLPPGDYEYRNTSRFQNNMVGRDESNTYPPIPIKVIE